MAWRQLYENALTLGCSDPEILEVWWMTDSDSAPQRVPTVLRDAGEDDGDVYVVGVRESADPMSWTLLFMEPYDMADEQEIALGMDTYCLVVDPGQSILRRCDRVRDQRRSSASGAQ